MGEGVGGVAVVAEGLQEGGFVAGIGEQEQDVPGRGQIIGGGGGETLHHVGGAEGVV